MRQIPHNTVLLGAWLLMPVILLIDVQLPLGYAGGMPYVVPVALALWAGRARHAWALAVAATLLTVAGFFLSTHEDGIPWTVYVNRAGALAAVWAVAFVVARQLGTRRLLRDAEARLEEAQRVAHIGSLDCDLERNTVWASPEARRLLGLDTEFTTPEQLLDRVMGADRERVRAEMLAARSEDGPRRAQARVEVNGAIRVVELVGRRIAGERGRPMRAVGTVQDISERKQLEEELLHAQKLEAVGRLASGVGHDVNNVLMGINGCIDVAATKLEATSPARPFLDEAKKAASSGAAIVRQLVAFGRKGRVHEAELELDSLIGEAEQMLRRLLGETVRLRMQLGAYGAFVRADPGQLQQVLMNLVVNARDAMPRGGTLTVQTAEVTLGRSDTRRYPKLDPGHYVTLAVTDTGSGMDAAVLARAFEPFFTTKELGRGTGLGLSTTYSIIERIGGHIDVESEIGVGTTFRIFFPREETAARTAPTSSAGVEPALGRGERVLVVEDEPLVRRAVSHYLERSGYRVLVASDAEAALALLRDRSESIDVLLTDVVLPGMSGVRLAETLQRESPELLVLYMSANTDVLDEGDRPPAEATLLRKPFSEEELAAQLRRVLDAGARAPAGATVLIIEDNDAARLATAELLSELGHAVLTARDGAEARALCARHGAEIRVVLTDLGLPDVAGHDLVAELRAALPGVGVIYVSGRPRDDELVRTILTEPVTEYLQKPVDFDEIATSVSKMLH